jgi:HEAT repeat protein
MTDSDSHNDRLQEAEALLKRLQSHDYRVRAAAEQSLRHFGPKIVEVILRALEDEPRRRRRRRALTISLSLSAGLLVFFGFVLGLHNLTYGMVLGIWIGFGLFYLLWSSDRFKNMTAGEIASVLAQYDDLRAIGPLLEALNCPEPDVRVLSELALARLLPRLTAADAALLNEEQYLCLFRALYSRYTDLVVGVIRAFREIGDERALLTVRQLAGRPPRSPRQQFIHRAARECLPALQERLERERAGNVLLRPASQPTETLPRPVMTDPDHDPEVLVRPYPSAE